MIQASILGKNKGKFIVGIGLGVLVLVAFGLYGDFNKIRIDLANFRWNILPLILLLSLGNYVIRFVKWHYYLSLLSIRISTVDSMYIFLSGLSMSVTPGKFGEVLKSILLKQRTETPISYSAPVVVTERLTDFISLLIMSVMGVSAYKKGWMVMGICIALTVLFFCIAGNRNLSLKLIRKLGRLPLISKYEKKLVVFHEGVSRLIPIVPLVLTTILSILSWLCEAVGFYLVLICINAPIPLGSAIFIYSFATIAGAVTMLPGGLGSTEAIMTGLIQLQNVAKSTAVASTLIIRVCTLWFAVLVGAIALILTQARFGLKDEDMRS